MRSLHKAFLCSDVTMCAQNAMTWPTNLSETGNLPSSASTGILIALLCTSMICRQNLMSAFSCCCLYPVLLLKSRSIRPPSNCPVYGYHTSEPYVRIGSTKLPNSCVIASTLIIFIRIGSPKHLCCPACVFRQVAQGISEATAFVEDDS